MYDLCQVSKMIIIFDVPKVRKITIKLEMPKVRKITFDLLKFSYMINFRIVRGPIKVKCEEQVYLRQLLDNHVTLTNLHVSSYGAATFIKFGRNVHSLDRIP